MSNELQRTLIYEHHPQKQEEKSSQEYIDFTIEKKQ
jgi:hypothetical protein